MSVAYCLIYEQSLNKAVGSNKAEHLALYTDQLNELLESQSLKLIDDYVIEDFSGLSELAEELDVSFSEEDSTDPQWFDAAEGVRWLEQLSESVENRLPALLENSSLMDDIRTLKDNLKQAVQEGVKWRLQVDFED